MASGLTRNQVPGNRLRVRIPCPPLSNIAADVTRWRLFFWDDANMAAFLSAHVFAHELKPNPPGLHHLVKAPERATTAPLPPAIAGQQYGCRFS